MPDLFDTLIDPLIEREGGYSNRLGDRGGPTCWGITIKTARENGYTGPMPDLPRERAKAIYKGCYWIRPGLHLIAPLSRRITEELFDTGVNMGVGTAAIILQRCLNVLNREGRDYDDLKVDGGIGKATAEALKGYLTVRGVEGETVLLRAMNCLQGAHYITLAESAFDQEQNAYGWLSARVEIPA